MSPRSKKTKRDKNCESGAQGPRYGRVNVRALCQMCWVVTASAESSPDVGCDSDAPPAMTIRSRMSPLTTLYTLLTDTGDARSSSATRGPPDSAQRTAHSAAQRRTCTLHCNENDTETTALASAIRPASLFLPTTNPHCALCASS